MITEQKINLFQTDSLTHAIAHQANCCSVMNGGLAKKIREVYPEAYDVDLRAHRATHRGGADPRKLGSFTHVYAPDCRLIFNIYGQLYFGRDRQYTDYDALRLAFTRLLGNWEAMRTSDGLKTREPVLDSRWHHRPIELSKSELDRRVLAVPYGMGCGLGGGDWNVVRELIEEVFSNSSVNILICRNK